jgi:hypothetical protein
MEMIQQAFHSILATEILMLLAVIAFFVFTVRMVNSIREDRKGWLMLAGILLLGLALRVGWIAWTQPQPVSDFGVYWQYANAFHNGDLTYNIIIRHPGTILLYTYAFYLLGPSLLTGWIMNLFLSAVMLLTIYALTVMTLNSKALGRWAMLAAALLPQAITYTALMATEIPGVIFSLLVLWAMLYSKEREQAQPGIPQWLYWVGIGELLYGTVLIRSSNLIFLVLVPMVFLITRRDDWKRWTKQFAVMTVTTCVLLSSWVYHQDLVGGSPKLFWGDALWMACAINYKNSGGYTNPKELPLWPQVEPTYKQFEKTGTPRDEAKFYDVLGREVMKVIMADPGKYLINGFPRLKRTIWTSQTGMRWTERGSTKLKTVPEKALHRFATISNVIWQVLLLLSPLGFLNLFRRQYTKSEGLWFIFLFTGSWLVFYLVLAEANERYSFQLIPFVLILVMSAFSWLSSLFKQPSQSSRQDRAIETATASAT